ncbi:ATP-binding protein [Nodosilinea sp. P-1105]|uniref:AAA family ATPase n=1 Tax=Nodosilinea sp. P-1105 TaxID=2546229 RepID=UPI00146EA262
MESQPRQRSPERGTGVVLDFRDAELGQIVSSLAKGQGLLVLGESGSGKSELATAIAKHFESQRKVAIATYGGSAKECLVTIAEALDVPTFTADDKPKPLTAEQLRKELLYDLRGGRALLIVDDAHRFPASLRYWLEDVLKQGGLLLLLADRPPARDVFLKLPRMELEPLTPDQIRTVMYQEATNQGLAINPSRFADLQQRVGGNPALAKRVIHEELMGIGDEMSTDHRQYIDGTPFLIASLSAISIVRFIGIGMGDKALYMVGGIAMILAMTLRTLFYSLNRKSTRLGR